MTVGLVGVGGISGAHIPAWEAMEDTELVALCDIRPERMESFSAKHCYTDFDEMLEKEKLDIVDICLPTYLHVEYSIKAMEKGIHVLCEKPVSLRRADVKRVYETAKKANVRFMIAQVLRFWPEYELVKDLYDSKKYGALVAGTMTRLGSFPDWSWNNWMADETLSGLIPYDLHIHDLDFMVYAFGAPKQHSVRRCRRADSDFLSITYDYDGFFIDTQASWYNNAYPFSAQFRFQFENAVVAYEDGVLKIYEKGGKVVGVSDGASEDSGTINLPKTDAYANEIRYFTDCVLAHRACDKVKAEELEAVLDIIENI